MMKSDSFKILSVILLSLISGVIISAVMHACGSGYFIDPRTIQTATPTPGDNAEYTPYTTSWSESFDWSQGEFDGVTITENGSGVQLEMGDPIDFRPTQICVALSGEDAVAIHMLEDPSQYKKINLPKFGSESFVNPSRTAIDKDENCWVGGRGNGGLYKVRWDGDPSNDGEVLGSVQLSDNGTVGNARALAIDKNQSVWVGDYENSAVWKIRPDENAQGELTVTGGPYPAATGITNPGPYGAAVDSEGFLWIVGYEDDDLTPGFISKIDTSTGDLLATHSTSAYGIVIGHDGNIWVGGWDSGEITKINKDHTAWGSNFALIGPLDLNLLATQTDVHTRGIGMDTSNNIWVADSVNHYVYKIDPDTGAYLGKVEVGTGPIGITGDLYGNVWAVNRGSDEITKIEDPDNINPSDDNTDKGVEFDTGDAPYSYSDMVGFGLFNTVLNSWGTWTVNFDSGYDEPRWGSLSWRAKVNSEADVTARVRVAANEEALESATWSQEYLESPASLSLPDLRWMQIQVTFQTDNQTSITPVLEDFSIGFSLPE